MRKSASADTICIPHSDAWCEQKIQRHAGIIDAINTLLAKNTRTNSSGDLVLSACLLMEITRNEWERIQSYRIQKEKTLALTDMHREAA